MGGLCCKRCQCCDCCRAPQYDIVDEIVNSFKIVVFSTTWSSECDDVKRELNRIGTNYVTVEIDQFINCCELAAALRCKTGFVSLPMVFIDGKFIGGAAQIQHLALKNRLIPMVGGAPQGRVCTRRFFD